MSDNPLIDLPDGAAQGSGEADGTPYRVLARKYRPQDFSQLIGQDALVRTLTNAIKTGRLAHAYMLTGVRGVGKTTTARIIAKALNYVGPDRQGGPSLGPFDDCPICQAIAADRHVDVIEMDAASQTGVDDIRQVIENAQLRPMEARYKVFIIDEVHMLSKPAFNALLKTLEEPPEHTKFILATTEIRKVPVTVLSRCQRFDLRRVDAATLLAHFDAIVQREAVSAEAEALKLVARAADGSVRDGLSILDQAIALSDDTITEATVRDMLGLADRERVMDLFEAVMSGDAAAALAILEDLHAAGADPLTIGEDLLDFTHFLTRAKAVPAAAEADDIPEAERVRGQKMARNLPMAALTRAWQMLLKGLGEVQVAPAPHNALEMVMLRLIYAADLDPPGDLVKRYQDQGGNPGAGPGGGSGGDRDATGGRGGDGARAQLRALPEAPVPAQAQPQAAVSAEPSAGAATSPMPVDLEGIVALCRAHKHLRLASELRSKARLVSLEPGRLEISLDAGAPRDLSGQLSERLKEWTGRHWFITISQAPDGTPTLMEREAAIKSQALRSAEDNPVVQEILRTFPDAQVVEVRDLSAPEALPAIVANAMPGGEQPEATAPAADPDGAAPLYPDVLPDSYFDEDETALYADDDPLGDD